AQQPVRANPLPAPIQRWPREKHAVDSIDWKAMFQDFDAIWGYHLSAEYLSYLRSHCGRLDARDEVVLARACREFWRPGLARRPPVGQSPTGPPQRAARVDARQRIGGAKRLTLAAAMRASSV